MRKPFVSLSFANLKHNAEQYRAIIGAQACLAMVVKGNAYGHGICEIAQMADRIDTINMLCTFSLSEALTIRACNVKKDILVMGYWQDADCKKAAHNNIHFMVDSLEQLDVFNQVGIETDCRIPIHIKIDSGLSRFGINPNDIRTFIATCLESKGLELRGICTHLAEKNNIQSDFTQEQITILKSALSLIPDSNLSIHATTTTDSLLLKNSSCNLFRVGLGLYGYLPSNAINQAINDLYPTFSLLPILTWKAPIIRIKTIPSGKTIGYDRAYTAQKEMKIAIIPIGYSDGFLPMLTKQDHLYIQNIKAPMLPNTTAMNVCMIDITHIPDVTVGDMVTIFDTKIGNELIQENNCNIRTQLAIIGRHIPRIMH